MAKTKGKVDQRVYEKVCKYCGMSESEIRRENRQYGFRIPCCVRDTEKGFHKFRLRLRELEGKEK